MRLQLFFITILMVAVTKPPVLITSIDWYLGALVCFAVSLSLRWMEACDDVDTRGNIDRIRVIVERFAQEK